MARSGGTLISKCIGCMDNIALLSEIHPFTATGQFNPLLQANNWLGVDVATELQNRSEGQDVNWLEAIELIHHSVTARGSQLVVRDWTHLDYTGVPWVEPSYQLTTAQVLATRFEIHQAFTVRHPIEQWNSLIKLGVIEGKLDVATFMKGYRAFAEQSAQAGFVRYEDFTADPEDSMQQLCAALAINYDPGFISKWSSFTKVTGDVSAEGPGRATTARQITPLIRREPDTQLLETFRQCPDFAPSLELLGYSE
jgi:hypothetical protein